MSRPRAHLAPEAWPAPGETTVRLTGDAFHHLTRVLRLRPGDAFQLFDGAGRQADATITSVSSAALDADLGPTQQVTPPAGPRLHLWVATLKADKLEWVAQKVTELGVDVLQPVETARSVPRPKAAAVTRRQERLARITLEATRQCGRAYLPTLAPAAPLAAALDALDDPAGDAGDSLRLVCWEHAAAEDPLRRRLAEATSPTDVLLLVGPEGGLTDAEVAALETRGFLRASLGSNILRAETAAIAAVTLAAAHVGRLG